MTNRPTTSRLAGMRTRRISTTALQQLVDDRYDGNVSAAAESWDLNQSHLCRALKDQRCLKPSVIQRIAKRERVQAESLFEQLGGSQSPRLEITARDDEGRFKYDVHDPARMLLQLEHWFADTPTKDGMRSGVVKAVMRTLFDASFDEVHKPTSDWKAVMDFMNGWVLSLAQERRRGRA